MAEVQITIPNSDWSLVTGAILWSPSGSARLNLGSTLSAGGATDIYLAFLQLPSGASHTNVALQTARDTSETQQDAGPEFSQQMEGSGTIELTASDGSTVTLTGIGDSSEPYSWQPSNLTDVRAFATTLRGLTDRSLTAVFNDNAAVAPGVPQEVTATPGNMSIMLGWAAPESDGGADIACYDLRFRAGTEGDWTERTGIGTGTARAYELTGLVNDQLYQLQLRAQNSAGAGPWSATVEEEPRETTTVPDAPAAPSLASVDGGLTVTWDAPADDGGPSITAYNLRYRQSGTGGNEVTVTVPNSNWSSTASVVQWIASTGNRISIGSTLSAANAEMFLTTLVLPRGMATHVQLVFSPNQNTGGSTAGPEFSQQMESSGTIELTASDGSTVTLTGIGDSTEPYAWEPSNIAAVRTFANTLAGLSDRSLTVTFNDNSWGGTEVENAWTSGELAYSITGLTNNTSYEVQVQAVNSLGDSEWSPATAGTPREASIVIPKWDALAGTLERPTIYYPFPFAGLYSHVDWAGPVGDVGQYFPDDSLVPDPPPMAGTASPPPGFPITLVLERESRYVLEIVE